MNCFNVYTDSSKNFPKTRPKSNNLLNSLPEVVAHYAAVDARRDL